MSEEKNVIDIFNGVSIKELKQYAKEANMSVKDLTTNVFNQTIETYAQFMAHKDEYIQIQTEDGKWTPSFEEIQDKLTTNIAVYADILNSYDKDNKQIQPSFPDMVNDIDKSIDKVQNYNHALSAAIENFENKIDKSIDAVKDKGKSILNIANHVKDKTLEKGVNVLKSVKTKCEHFKDECIETKDTIIEKWDNYKQEFKDAVDNGIDKGKELSDKTIDFTKDAAKKCVDAANHTANYIKTVCSIGNDMADYKINKFKESIKHVGSKIKNSALNIYGKHLSKQIKFWKDIQAQYTNELNTLENNIDVLKSSLSQQYNIIASNEGMPLIKADEIKIADVENMIDVMHDLENVPEKSIEETREKLNSLKTQLGMESKAKNKSEFVQKSINDYQDKYDSLSLD